MRPSPLPTVSHARTSAVAASSVLSSSHVLQERIWSCSPRLLRPCSSSRCSCAWPSVPALPFCRHVCVLALKPWRRVHCLPSAAVLTSPPLAPPPGKLLVLRDPLRQRVPGPRLRHGSHGLLLRSSSQGWSLEPASRSGLWLERANRRPLWDAVWQLLRNTTHQFCC